MSRKPLWEQLGLAYDSRAAGIVAIAENEAAVNPSKPVLSGEAVLHLIQALRATERRLTVERIEERAVARYCTCSSDGKHRTTWKHCAGFRLLGHVRSILQEGDDLATADVDEQMAEANREMEADLWNSDR